MPLLTRKDIGHAAKAENQREISSSGFIRETRLEAKQAKE